MIELLSRLCSAHGVSGREDDICKVISDELSGIADNIHIDKNNNVIAKIGSTEKYNIMLDAHIDQIGFIVTHIDDNGFLKVSSVGGMDLRVAHDSRFKVQTDSGELTAVVCCLPPHLSDGGEDKAPNADSIFLDTGLPAERVRSLVQLGDTAVYDSVPTALLNDRFTCCATDNRACCALLIRVAQLIKLSPVKAGVTLAFTSQEETYGKGALTAAYTISPDEAISTDVSFARQGGVADHEAGVLGGGAMICISPVLSRKMSYKLIDTAKENSLPYQLEIVGGLTGTNADKISTVKSGIPTALVSIPQRSMHTAAEIVSAEDIENTAKLIYKYIENAAGENDEY